MLLVDDDDRVLLIEDSDLALDPVVHWWSTPGGGVDPGETDAQAAVRELWEETGLRVSQQQLEGPLLTRTVVHGFSDKVVRQLEVFFRVRVPAFEVDVSGHTVEEQLTVADIRWWSVDALEDTGDPVWPADLRGVLALADSPQRWVDGPVTAPEVEESTVPA